jgi:hypothetical protein
MMKTPFALIEVGLAALVLCSSGRATETETHVIPVLPAPGGMTIDGNADDWDLSGGVFACADVENQREQFAVWLHAMHDAEKLARILHTPSAGSGNPACKVRASVKIGSASRLGE